MIHRPSVDIRSFLGAVGRVFAVFFPQGRKARRTRFFFLLTFLPVAVSLVIKFNQIFSGRTGSGNGYLFSNLIMLFYLQLIVLILALFYGTSVCSEEVEGKTLPYLITRPIPKAAVVLGKYAAYTAVVTAMVTLGLVLSFLVLNLDRLLDAAVYRTFGLYLGVLILAAMAYGALFTFLGSFLKRSIFFGLLFCFGWENVIQYFPGSTQRLAIAHYLKSFLPATSSGRFSILTFRLEPTARPIALLMLFLITAALLALACLVFMKKDYILDD
ncbi:MAG: ABC transporter permease [Candidatus Aminicenantes bacterium]|nr:ABC transporter permease [Candidatus Aminicenantes bacterium]